MPDFAIKETNKNPSLRATLERDGEPFDLAENNITSVTFIMGSTDAAPKVNDTATMVDKANGIVRYDWSTGDTDTPGEYKAEFVCQDTSSNETTFPDEGYIEVEVVEQVQRT